MKEQKHINGEWHYEVECYVVLVHDGCEVEELQYEIKSGSKVIARINNRLPDEEQEENARLIAAAPYMLAELMNHCAECRGNGSERCASYDKNGDMCRMAQDETCDTWMAICWATGHDPAEPWEVTK